MSRRGLVTLGLLGALLGACAPGGESAAGEEIEAPTASYRASDPFAMEVGDCFDDTAMGVNEVSDLPGLPCTEPHDNEVFALFDLPAGPYPGDEEIDALAGIGCYERFERAIGRSYDESEIDFLAMYPTEDSWTQIDDREVVCIAFHMEYQKLTGSVLESGR